MNNMKKVMVLGASILQVPIIKQAKALGYCVIAIDMNKDAVGFRYSDTSYPVSTIDIESVLEIARSENIDSIVTAATDMPMKTVAMIGEKLKLKTIPVETALNCTNKYSMRSKLKQHKVPIPTFYKVRNYDDYSNAISAIQGEKIIKPVDSSGSRGVYFLDQMEDIEYAYEYAMQNSNSNEIIVEEYMRGPEVSVETITLNGKTHIIAITDKITSGSPHFIELGHSIQSNLSKQIKKAIYEITMNAVQALGINIGPAHTEIIITSEGPKIVEVGARLGGDNITSHLVPLATGHNLLEYHIQQSLGENIHLEQDNNQGAAIKFINSEEGQIEKILIPNDFQNDDEIIELVFNYKEGDIVKKTNNSANRMGYVIVQSENAENALRKCDEIINQIEIKYV